MNMNRKTFAALALAVIALVALAACELSIGSPTIVTMVTVNGTAKDPTTKTSNPATAAACPVDRVQVSAEGEMANGTSQRLDATAYYLGEEISKTCALTLPKRWTILTLSTCEIRGTKDTHNPQLYAIGPGKCEVLFSQGGVSIDEDEPVSITIK